MTTAQTLTNTELHALSLDGVVWRQGSLYGSSPQPPLLAERAELVAKRLPDWAIAAGHTAGWVWTGLGRPEPWSLMCPKQPALSPIQRAAWKPRSRQLDPQSWTVIRGLQILNPAFAVADLLESPGDDDVAAAQIFELTNATKLAETLSGMAPLPPRTRDRARRRRALVNQWWQAYPVVTR